MEEMVTLSVETYEEILHHESQLKFVTDMLLCDASLAWDKKSLAFNDKTIDLLLKTLKPARYELVLSSLQAVERDEEVDM